MIIEDVISFLKKVPPFQFLSEEELQGIALNLTMEFYPKDTLILRQGDKNVDALRINRYPRLYRRGYLYGLQGITKLL
jgi:CBS domain-containing protein